MSITAKDLHEQVLDVLKDGQVPEHKMVDIDKLYSEYYGDIAVKLVEAIAHSMALGGEAED